MVPLISETIEKPWSTLSVGAARKKCPVKSAKMHQAEWKQKRDLPHWDGRRVQSGSVGGKGRSRV